MLPQSINLLPPPSKEEIVKVKVKTNIDLSGIVFVFFIVLVSLVILIANLYFKGKVDKYTVEKETILSLINGKKDVEQKYRINFNKWMSYKIIKNIAFKDYQEKINSIKDYSNEGCIINKYSIANDNTFTVSGNCNSYESFTKLFDGLKGSSVVSSVQMKSLVKQMEDSPDNPDNTENLFDFSIGGTFKLNDKAK